MTNTDYKTTNFPIASGPRIKRPPLSLFRRPIADIRAREIARAAAIEVLG